VPKILKRKIEEYEEMIVLANYIQFSRKEGAEIIVLANSLSFSKKV